MSLEGPQIMCRREVDENGIHTETCWWEGPSWRPVQVSLPTGGLWVGIREYRPRPWLSYVLPIVRKRWEAELAVEALSRSGIAEENAQVTSWRLRKTGRLSQLMIEEYVRSDGWRVVTAYLWMRFRRYQKTELAFARQFIFVLWRLGWLDQERLLHTANSTSLVYILRRSFCLRLPTWKALPEGWK